MIIIFVEFIDQLIEYPMNCASFTIFHGPKVRLYLIDIALFPPMQNFSDCLYAFPQANPLPKRGHIYKECIWPESKFLP